MLVFNDDNLEQIIIELKDPSSDIHLLLGRYTAKKIKSVRFKQNLIVYAVKKNQTEQFSREHEAPIC